MAYLQAKNIHKTFENTKVLKNISIDIPQGEIIGVVGRNGCGKSTLLNILSRQLSFDHGEVNFRGQDIQSYPLKDLAQHISLLPQLHPHLDIPVKNLVSYGRQPYKGFFQGLDKEDYTIIDQALKTTRIHTMSNKSLAELSGGERQRAWVAMTLAQEPELLFLDEPTTYLDVSAQLEIMHLIKELKGQGLTIVVVLHDLNQAYQYCDQLIIMEEGQVVTQGASKDVLTLDILREIFQVKGEFLQSSSEQTILHLNEVYKPSLSSNTI
jgi:iron complex transport system ATP-binding protein